MGKVTRYPATVVLAVLFLLPGISTATTYRVGPGEEYAKVSEVADRLRAGDVVEITGDISDIFTLTANGTSEKPIVIRGVTRVENGQIIRPRITPPSVPCGNLITCKGDWTVLEGLDISGQTEGAYGNAAIIQACADFTIRNCRIHHNYRAIHSLEESTGDTVVEFCELYANGYAERPPVAFYSTRLGAKITVQHCYFHDGTGGNFLRVCMPRAVVRYNWFENPYEHAVQVSTPEFGATPERIALGDSLLPYHCDIVGNVVVFGWGPGSPYCAFSLGGDSSEAPGTEGDFNIAHNLVLTRRGGATPQVAVVVHGNVDHVNLFNNVILEGGVRGCMVYSREMVFEGPRTEAFRTRRGGDPVISGVNNWISKTAFGVPDTLKATISGVNPKFMNFVGYEFHPQPESPLTRGGLWPLPEGKVGNLSPEYEPQRGIPADLRPVARRKVSVPSMGPYEASETPPAFADDSSELVLNVKDSGGRFAWPFDFGGWRRKALENLYAGRPTEALACAKMQFLLSPMDEPTIDAAIESVKQMIVALDGDDARALAFEQYARYGPEGKDGRRETEDNLRDPLMDVGVPVVGGITSSLEGLDVAIDARASVGSGAPWLMTEPERHWYRTEKALVALQTAQFEEALLALSGVLSEIARQPAGDLDNQKVAQRNQSIIDRVTAGLSVVARSRCNSVADVSEFVNRYLTYARFGPAGPDGEMGTSDDIEPDGVRSISRHVWSSPDEALALIKSTHPDTPLLAAVEARVEAVQDSYRRFVKQLELVVSESRFVATGGPAYAGSAPREFLGQMLAKTASAPPLPAGLDEQETAMVAAALRQVLESADAAALDAYLALSAAGLSEQSAPAARACLSAYGLAVHDASTFPLFATMLSARLTSGKLPLFLVSDALDPLGDPFLAAEVLDALCNYKGTSVPEDERRKLSVTIESAQFALIESMDRPPVKLPADQRAEWYKMARTRCIEYLSRFSSNSAAETVEFQKGLYCYRSKDYRKTIDDCREFVSKYPESGLVPGALLVKALAAVDLGQKKAALPEFDEIAKKYPQHMAAPRALYAGGSICLSSQDYDGAKRRFQDLTDLYPDDPYAARAREALRALTDSSSTAPKEEKQ